MKRNHVIVAIILLALLSACGLKKNLELPKKTQGQQTGTSSPTGAPDATIAPSAVSTTLPPTSTGNPAAGN